MLELRKL